jgi:hypothetical protein
MLTTDQNEVLGHITDIVEVWLKKSIFKPCQRVWGQCLTWILYNPGKMESV